LKVLKKSPLTSSGQRLYLRSGQEHHCFPGPALWRAQPNRLRALVFSPALRSSDRAFASERLRLAKLQPDKKLSEGALEARARRAARRVGLIARKSRWRQGSIDNFGEFMLVDLYGNYVVAGSRFDMTAEDVIAYCESD
jgi:hypothetical protein